MLLLVLIVLTDYGAQTPGGLSVYTKSCTPSDGCQRVLNLLAKLEVFRASVCRTPAQERLGTHGPSSCKFDFI